MKKLICLCMITLLLLAATACSSKNDSKAKTDGANASTSDQAKGSAFLTYQDSTRSEWLQKGYWCKVADDEKSIRIYTFTEKDAGDGMLEGNYTLYHIVDGKIVKAEDKDNPSIFKYKLDGDQIVAADVGGTAMNFSLSADGKVLTQSSDGSDIAYRRTAALTDSYAGTKALLSQ